MDPQISAVLTYALLVLGWLIGSIPIGFLIGLKKFGVNLTKVGSGGIGETNFVRALVEVVSVPEKLAKKWGKLVEGLDIMKGLIPVVILRAYSDGEPRQVLLLGVGLILGHCYSAFLRLKGGKGVATTMGIGLAINWPFALMSYLVWWLVKKALAKKTKEATAIGSMVAGVALFVLNATAQHLETMLSWDFAYDPAFAWLFLFIMLHIIIAHRGNIRRMSEELRGDGFVPVIAVDLMGSDEGPEEIARGIYLAMKRRLRVKIIAVGNVAALTDSRIRRYLDGVETRIGELETEDLRNEYSSVAVCARLVRLGQAHAMYSCGNSQLAVAWTRMKRGIGMLEGFSVPPLSLVLPNRQVGKTILLDAGANVECSLEQLIQFVHLGVAQAKVALGIKNPKTSVLSNGTEPYKGTGLIQEVAAKLLGLNFRSGGQTEANRIMSGDSHVIVTDGFTGNIAFKALEGGAAHLSALIKQILKRNPIGWILAPLLKLILAPVKRELDPAAYGAIVLLGTKPPEDEEGNRLNGGLSMIGHGAATAREVAVGIETTAGYVRMDLIRKMADLLVPLVEGAG